METAEASTELVQRQLSEFFQQIVHVTEACNKEQDVLEQEFDSVRNAILIMESCHQNEKTQIDSEVPALASMMQFAKGILKEVRLGIHILQEQDNEIVGDATHSFARICWELKVQNKKIIGNELQVFAI